MEYWKRKSEDYMERCDFQGLPRSSQATKEKAIPYGYRNTVLNGSTFKYLSSISNKSSPLRLQALINLAWHKTLNVFGNGSHTITLTCLEVHDQGFKLIPVMSDHPRYSDRTVGEILRDVEMDMENCLRNKLTLDLESEIPEDFCDSFILWGDEEVSQRWNAPLILQIEGRASAAFDIGISYNCNLFEEVIIDGVMNFFMTVVGELAKDEHQASTLSSIEFLPPDQKKQIEQWNDVTTGDYPENKRLHHLVEEAAASTPDNVAVICEDRQVTYEELNERANQVGYFLHSREGVKVEQFIALFLDKTETLLMTILGIWKSGAAHIPIDPQYPDERVRFTLEDTGAKILITNGKYRERLEGIFSEDKFQLKIISVEELFKMAEVESKENLDLPLRSDQLAYVTYTSGTTGVPKGVYKEHKGVVNSITDLSIRYEMRKRAEVVALFSAYVWEPFIRQTFIALANSQLLVIADDTDKLDQLKFLHFLNKYGVTYLNGTGSVLQEYELEKCPTLTKLILVGEELTKRRYDSLREKFNGRLICEYGFTESALVTCMNNFNLGDQRVDRSIGLPLRNVKAYVLSNDLKRVPVGAIGELYVGGVGISRGYMNRDSLTNERFLTNPFQSKEEKAKGINNLMYKTGDLTRWIGNGKIEYIGRNDFQIKLRGTRIEPSEIESVVLQYPSVSKCTVAVKDSKPMEESTASSRHLVGYFAATQVIPEEEVIRYLENKLPRYMIPVRMVQVDDIRTNINGKVDLKALPEVELIRELKPEDKVHNPRNEVDSKLIKIWSDAVGIPEVGIGIHDDFFRLGGHSITCIQLVARIRQQFSCDVSIDNIFSLRTIEKLSDFISSQIDAKPLQTQTLSLENNMGQDENNEILANSLQQGLVYHHLKQGVDDDAYIMQTHYQYSEPVHVEFYRRAWELTQTKYPSLRLNFKVRKEVYQVFRSEQSSHLDWTFLDICKASDLEAEIDNVINGDRARRYNLEMGPLFRIYLVKQSDTKYSLIFSYHHIIFDGWSIPILFNFVHETYKRLLSGSNPDDKEAKSYDKSSLPDTAYLLSQRYFQAHRNDHLDYWTTEVEQVDQRVNLSGLLKPEVKYKVQLNNYDRIMNQKQLTQQVNPELLKNLQSFGATNGLTLHSILQFAWHKVLHTFGAGSHTIVGTTVFGRNIPVDGVESAVGLFINTLPLVVNHLNGRELSVNQAIQEIQKKVNAMNSKSIVELGRLGSGNGELKHFLFDSLFVLEPDMDMGTFMGFRMVNDYEKLDYPLAVIAREENGVLKFTLCYAGELFEDEVIQDVLELLEYFLHQVASDPGQPVQNMKLVLPKQLYQLEMWNQTRKSFPEDKTLHEVFEGAAASNPSKIALVYDDSKWTYKRLNVMSNQLANYLRALVTINPDDKIALILSKNDLLILSILGVWKSGGAFVPIDPSYPEDRIQFMLEDTQAKLGIVNAANTERLGGILQKNSIKVVTIEETMANSLFGFDTKNLPRISSSTDLCYVIYTSGTTGRPKGVMTEHRGVVNLHDSLSTIFGLKSSTEEALLSFSNFVFDHFVEQMTDALLSGQTLVVLNDEMRTDKERLYKYIRDNNVTYLSGTPSVLSLYEYGDLNSITRLDAVGEDFTEPHFNKIRSTYTSGIIINGYGPTETSITTHKRIYRKGERRLDKSIGHQIHNSTCYILNESGQRVPIGAVGELHLGGIGVGRGYLNRDDLTKKSFVENPFVTEEERLEGRNLRLYKTGDLARFLGNGEVECLGRNDFQVKVRGLRIELSEIEAIILSFPGITHCVVVAQNHEDSATKFLVGYYISKSPQSERSLLNFLQNKLPTFMMPNRLVQVDTIPVTINGKCDTKKLPKVNFIKGENLEDNLNLNEIETKLRFIWSELLGLPVEQIGLHDDFFSLGGDSLLVTSMTFMINKAFGKVIGVPQAFLHKTIKSLGHLISESGRHRDEEIPKLESSFAPASLAQERLLFIDEMEEGIAAFNVPFVFKLKYCNIKKAVESLKLVAKRHGALRTLLVKFQDSYGQKLLNDDEFDKLWLASIHFKNVNTEVGLNKEIYHLENSIFKLDQELPLRVTFIKMLKTDEYFAVIVFHHTCFDGWSLPIFQRDWMSYYSCLQAELEGTKEENLPKLPYHYQEFSLLQKNLLTGSTLADLRLYWLEKLSNVEQLILPIDFGRPSRFSYQGYEISRQLNHCTTTALKNFARVMKTSLFSVLVSAFALTLSIYSGQEDILIGSPISNRIRSEFENVIGFFINILPLKFNVNQNWTVADFIESVGTEVVTSHVNQDMPFEKLVRDLKIDKDLSRHPLVQVMLNFNPLSGPVRATVEQDEEDQAAPFNLIENVAEEGQDTTAKYDLSATVTEKGTGLLINFTYAKSIFCEDTIRGYLDSFVHFLSIFSQPENQEKKLKELDLVGKKDRVISVEQPLINGNDTTLPEVFEQVAAQSGGAQTAVVYKDNHVTYNELNARSNQVAGLLRRKIPTGNGIVALVMDKSDWMITSILGVWKSGSAYVPIDPVYPTDRINFILKDTGATVILTNQGNESRLKQLVGENNLKTEMFIIDHPQTLSGISKSLEASSNNNLKGDNLCYIIYTSGSTGVPKGVMITHNNVLSFRESLLQHHNKNKTVLFLSNFAFDFSIEQIILSIFNWGKLIIIENEFVIDDQLYVHLNREGLTYLSGTPSVITALDLSRFSHLETVTVAGEKFKQTHFNKIRSGFEGRLINAYGVTETTVYNSLSEFGPGDISYRNTLGNFFNNTSYCLLDNHQRPVPNGAVAELYLAGPCLSPGYLNLEEMNEKHFLPNPDSSKDYPVLYRTGDLVRLKVSGKLEYLRRNDNQVKVRGLRIELAEVECAVLKHDSIKECTVLLEDENLVCIYLLSSEVLEEELHSFLECSLPPHMIPLLIKYEGHSLPVTINGKLDIKELKSYYRSKHSVPVSTYTPPTGKVEKVLCKIFSSVLDTPETEIGVHDDFFRLGGDSISSLLLAGKIRNQLGATCNAKHIFDFRTIRKLCQNVCSCKDPLRNQDQVNGVVKRDEALRPSGIVPLLPIQRWFFAKDLKMLNRWNQTFAFKAPPMDTGRLIKSLQTLVDHHDAFRLRFKSSPDGYIQQYKDVDLDNFKVNFHQLDVAGLDQAQIENQLVGWSSFDIERGPLYSVVYLEDKESNLFKIRWTVHHLIVDSVSWRIIKDDLQTLYEGGSLGGKGTSFQEFSLSLKDQFLSEKFYWKPIVEKVPSYNATFMEQAEKMSLNFKFDLDAPISKRLLRRSETETGIQDYLLTALGYALRRVTNFSTNYITLEGHGREMGDLSNTVGWFTTMYPIEIQMRPEDNIQSNIQRVKQSIRSIPNKGIGYGTIYGYVDPPLPCVSFNFLGNFGSNVDTEEEWNFCDLSLGLSSGDTETTSYKSIMDITAACDRGHLKFSVDCLLNRKMAQEFIATFQNTLEQISKNLQGDVIKNSLPFGDYEAYFEFPSDVNSTTTLFILPPGEGGAECYFNNLLPHLRQFNLVVFNNYYLDRGPFHTTFEELASKYIRYVKAIQAKGPYNFLGWSFGGVLALEMSRQLTKSGDDQNHTENIFLIDSYLNVSKAVEDLKLQKRHHIIDGINHRYTPTSTDFEVMCSRTRNVTLFKATLPNEMSKSEEQHLLYEYFRHAPFNNLDTLIPSELITVKKMEAQSHVSWAKDCQLVGRISNAITKGMLCSKSIGEQ